MRGVCRVAIRVAVVTLLLMIIPAPAARGGRTQMLRELAARPGGSGTVSQTTVAAPEERIAPWAEPDDDDAVDLYGNGVSDAVARYRLDSDGTLYELHSPRTELPRLSAPRG